MIGSTAAIFTMGWMPRLPGLGLCLLLLLSSTLLAARRRGCVPLFLLGMACGICYAGYWGGTLLDERLPHSLEGEVLTVRGLILEPPQLRQYSTGGQRARFPFRVEHSECIGVEVSCASFRGKVLLSWYSEQPLHAGEHWQFQVRLKRPWGLANPGSFNFQSWLAQRRFAATGSVRRQGARKLPGAMPWYRSHQLLRQQVNSQLQLGFSDRRELGVLQALSSGDRSAIGHKQWRDFQHFGLNHLVVISGLHVGMVAAIGFLLGSQLGRLTVLRWALLDSPRVANLCAFALAFAYSALAGFALPTVRALVMLAAIQIAVLCQRRVRPGRSLLLALWVIALVDPLASHNAGFYLSFAAVALIFLLLYLRPGPGGLRQVLRLQLSLSVAMGLLGSAWFGGGSIIAPLANLVAIPVLSLMLAPLCLLASLSALQFPPVAQLLWSLAAWPVQGFFLLADYLQTLGLQAWVPMRLGPGQLLFAAIAMLLLLLPRAWPMRCSALLLALPLFFTPPQKLPVGVHEVTVFDVGQGLAVLIRGPEFAMLYDTGAGDPAGPNMASSVILPWLQSKQLDHLNLLVISHADRDHASGVYSIVDALQVDELWYGDSPYRVELDQQPCRTGRERVWGQLRVLQLHPAAAASARKSNNRSCVILLDVGGYRILIPGDIEAVVEHALVSRWGDQLGAQLILVPHHGSGTSSSSPFVRRVNPELAVYSSGYRNRFGHPQAAVHRRYRAHGVQTLNTASSGAITLTIEAGQLQQLQSFRQIQHYYWH
jgi:competence protein ComEC